MSWRGANVTLHHSESALYDKKELTVQEICEMMGISESTLYAYVREEAQRSHLLPRDRFKGTM
jgi:predicted DNA-binding transcriptional regulator AlpA